MRVGKVLKRVSLPVEVIEREYPEWIKDTIHFKNPITAESFKVEAPEGMDAVSVNIAELVDDQIINVAKTAVLPVKDGLVMRDPEKDIMKFASLRKVWQKRQCECGLYQEFQAQRGALAYSMSHNHQNISVIGANDGDMALAVNEVARIRRAGHGHRR